MQPVGSFCLDVNRTKFGFIYDEDIPDFVLMLNLEELDRYLSTPLDSLTAAATVAISTAKNVQ
jgi:hypothetical protein